MPPRRSARAACADRTAMPAWIDSHNHLQDTRLGEVAAVIPAMKAAGVSRCVVNATCEADWQAVANLADAHPDFVSPAFGIHPWHAATATDGWQQRLAILLEKVPQASIGECGIDSWVSEPALEIQRPVFTAQLRLAREMGRTITIHCLKAWGALFDCFSESPPPPRFLMHSFGGSIETARRLVPSGAYFSFSGYFLHPRKASVAEVFKQLPRGRILLETDAPDMRPPDGTVTHTLDGNLNHPANLAAIATGLAEILRTEPGELATRTARNFRDCFGIHA